MNPLPNVKFKLSDNLRKRIVGKKMGPQTEENNCEVIEMMEQIHTSDTNKDDNWENSEEGECEVMLKTSSTKPINDDIVEETEEGFWLLAFQVFFPFLIAGLGMVGAGIVLDIVQVRKRQFYIIFLFYNQFYYINLLFPALECIPSCN